MTAIGSAGLGQFTSPSDLLQSVLNSQVSAGTISSSDKSALSSAIDDIGKALKSDQASAGTSGAPQSPGDVKSKIDSLIASEVSSGKLTSNQADELKNVFAQAFSGGPHGGGGPDGPGSPGGLPLGGAGTNQSASGASQGSSGASNTNQLLQDFLASLQNSQGSSSYGASGDGQSSQTSLVLNYQT